MKAVLNRIKEAVLGKPKPAPPRRKPGIKDVEKALSETGKVLSKVRKALTNKVINVTELALVAEDPDGNWYVGVSVPQKAKDGVVPPPLIGMKFLPLASASPVIVFSDRDTETIPKMAKNLQEFKNWRFVTHREMNEKAEFYLEQVMEATREVLHNLRAAAEQQATALPVEDVPMEETK